MERNPPVTVAFLPNHQPIIVDFLFFDLREFVFEELENTADDADAFATSSYNISNATSKLFRECSNSRSFVFNLIIKHDIVNKILEDAGQFAGAFTDNL